MDNWFYISLTVMAKRYDDSYHIRKVNLETGKYSYMILQEHELEDILKIPNVIKEEDDDRD